MNRSGLVIFAAALCAAPAFAADNSSEACLRVTRIRDFHPLPGNHALIVTDKSSNKFKLSFADTCPNLQYHATLSFRLFSGSKHSCLSSGDYVFTSHSGNPNRALPARARHRCPIGDVALYTAEMQQADAEAKAAAKNR